MTKLALRWLRHPTLQLVGVAALAYLLTPSATDKAGTRHVQVTEHHIQALNARHELTHGQPPTREETLALIQRFIDEEVMVREARRMGLEHDDPIVRRRLVQKMQHLVKVQDTSPQLPPASNKGVQRARSFEQIFVRGLGDETQQRLRVAAIRKQLAANVPARQLGDPFVHGQRFSQLSDARLTKLFGHKFATEIAKAQPDNWTEIPSSFGTHLVLVSAVTQRVSVTAQQVSRVAPPVLAKSTLRERYTVQLPEAYRGTP